ncbi:MAG: zinc ribbon domain-containing protein [Thermodesulfovibrionales bacterium]
MPIYEYSCKDCNEYFSLLQWGSSNREAVCPQCGSENVKKQLSNFSCSCSIDSGSSYGGPSSGFSGG